MNQANLRLALGFLSLHGLAPELLGASERDEGGAMLGAVVAAGVGFSFRPALSLFVTPKGERGYSNYQGSKAHTLLREEHYGQLEFVFTLRAWTWVSANLEKS